MERQRSQSTPKRAPPPPPPRQLVIKRSDLRTHHLLFSGKGPLALSNNPQEPNARLISQRPQKAWVFSNQTLKERMASRKGGEERANEEGESEEKGETGARSRRNILMQKVQKSRYQPFLARSRCLKSYSTDSKVGHEQKDRPFSSSLLERLRRKIAASSILLQVKVRLSIKEGPAANREPLTRSERTIGQKTLSAEESIFGTMRSAKTERRKVCFSRRRSGEERGGRRGSIFEAEAKG